MAAIDNRHAPMPWSYSTVASVRRDMIGVYVFWFRLTGRCIYVGQTTDQTIRARLHQHWRGSHNEKLRLWMEAYGEHLDVCYEPIARNRIATIERRLIRLWRPEANVQHNR